jgi:hypothetical protein
MSHKRAELSSEALMSIDAALVVSRETTESRCPFKQDIDKDIVGIFVEDSSESC